MTSRRRERGTPVAVAVVAVVVALTAACGGGGDTVAVDPTTSSTTTTTTAFSLDALSEDYCERAAQLSDAGALRLDEDPGVAARSIDALAAVAPPALSEDYAVVSDQVTALGEVGTEGGGAALGIIDLLVDREFLAALDRIERRTSDDCGVRLDAGTDDAGDP